MSSISEHLKHIIPQHRKKLPFLLVTEDFLTCASLINTSIKLSEEYYDSNYLIPMLSKCYIRGGLATRIFDHMLEDHYDSYKTTPCRDCKEPTLQQEQITLYLEILKQYKAYKNDPTKLAMYFNAKIRLLIFSEILKYPESLMYEHDSLLALGYDTTKPAFWIHLTKARTSISSRIRLP